MPVVCFVKNQWFASKNFKWMPYLEGLLQNLKNRYVMKAMLTTIIVTCEQNVDSLYYIHSQSTDRRQIKCFWSYNPLECFIYFDNLNIHKLLSLSLNNFE